jgi:hypothetical protein
MPPVVIDPQTVLNLLCDIDPSKAMGPDRIPGIMLKQLANTVLPFFVSLFENCLTAGIIPEDWKKAIVVPLFKSGPAFEPTNYRPVSLTCITAKIFERVLHKNIYNYLIANGLLRDTQHGFRSGLSCESQLISLLHDLSTSMDRRKETDIIFLDFQKAFDKVPHDKLFFKLELFGIHPQVVSVLKSFLSDRTQRVVIDGVVSDSCRVTSGVPQGTVLGPLLFLMYIDDLPELLSSKCRLFADDTVIYREINKVEDRVILQDDLNTINEWCKKWAMSVNYKKCVYMKVGRLRNKSGICPIYKMNDIVLQEVGKYKYLGVFINNKLTWDDQIVNVQAKANRALGFVRRHLNRCPQHIKRKCYTAFVRPHLECCSAAWDPHLESHSRILDMIQRRAARFMCNAFSRDTRVSELLSVLHLEPLECRRRYSRLKMFYKLDRGLCSMVKPYNLLRKYEQRRSDNGYAYQHIPAHSNPLFSSFFVRTVREWNRLPEGTVLASSLRVFNDRLRL